MFVAAEWTSTPAKFFGAKDCCCCDRIGWVQIIKSKADYGGIFGMISELRDNHNWTIDGGIPYPGGWGTRPSSADPCENAATIAFGDAPERPADIGVYPLSSRLKSWEMELEACVVCLSGVEGPQVVEHHGGIYGSQWFEKRLTMYGCVRYSFSATRDPNTGAIVYSRGPVTAGPPTTSAWETALIHVPAAPTP
jgi:hypothetical protein